MSDALRNLGEALVAALSGRVTSYALAYGELTIHAERAAIATAALDAGTGAQAWQTSVKIDEADRGASILGIGLGGGSVLARVIDDARHRSPPCRLGSDR